MRNALRNWLPPAALRFRNAYRVTYASYAEALARCGSPGYLDDELGETVVLKTVDYFQRAGRPAPGATISTFEYQLMAALLAAAPAAGRRLRVLDFGGAGGAGFFSLRPLLPPALLLDWTVVETPSMVRAARRHIRAEGLSFSDDLDGTAATGAFDLVYSSGALQFTPDPFGFLDRLVAVGGRAIAVTRLQSTTADAPFAVVFESTLSGNGPGPAIEGLPPNRPVRYPCTFLPQPAVRAHLGRRYDIAFEGYDPTADSAVRRRPTTGWSYFGRLRPDAGGADAEASAR